MAKEFSDHADNETDALTRHLQDMEENSGQFRLACDQFSLPNHSFRYGGSSLPQKLRELAESLVANATGLDEEPECNRRAIQRVVAKEPPSTKGQVKDCVLLEEYLELTRQLRASGFALPVVFLSSNTADFAAGKGSNAVHPKLAAEFVSLGIAFTCVWGQAARELGLYP